MWGSKAKEGAHAMSLAFVLLDFLRVSDEEHCVRDGVETCSSSER